jgi:hypothetical protein
MRFTVRVRSPTSFSTLGAKGHVWNDSRIHRTSHNEPVNTHFEKDIRYEAIVVSRTSETLKWGNRPGDKDIIGSGKYRARLAFAAKKLGEELLDEGEE